MKRQRKSLGRLLCDLHHTHKGAAKSQGGTATSLWPRGMASAAKKLLPGKRLSVPKLGLSWGRKKKAAHYGAMEDSPISDMKVDQEIQSFAIPTGINATIQVDMEETKTRRVFGRDVVLRSRRMSRRVSVTSLPTQHQKVSHRKKRRPLISLRRRRPVEHRRHSALTIAKLQTQVDGLVEAMADRSAQLLTKRQEELQHCEAIAEHTLDTSRQFHRVTSKAVRRHWWRKACIFCTCCC